MQNTKNNVVKLDSKHFKIKQGLAALCEKHGLHKEWRSYNKHTTTRCKFCEKEYQKIDRKNNPVKFLLRDAKQHAKAKKREFVICENDILELIKKQNNCCALSGMSFDNFKMSLDRINSTKGYTKDNIQLVTVEINRMKSDFDINVFIDFCKKVTEKNK